MWFCPTRTAERAHKVPRTAVIYRSALIHYRSAAGTRRRWGIEMRVRVSIVMTQAVVVAAVSACVGQPPPPPEDQGAEYRAPRTAEGRPDLNGIWQALNTASYDLEAHAARPALQVLPAAARSEPPGLGRATRVELPAGGAAGAWRRGRRAGRGERGGRRCDSLPAVGAGAQEREPPIGSNETRRSSASFRVCRARPTCRTRFRFCKAPTEILIAYEYNGTHAHHSHGRGVRQPEPDLDGLVARPLGRRHAGRRSHRLQRRDVVRPRRQFSQRCVARRRTVYARELGPS